MLIYRKVEINDFLTAQSQKIRDLIAYRIVISMPQCHLERIEDRETEEIKHLYKIANVLPKFLEEHGFTPETAGGIKESTSPLLDDAVRPCYRDYVSGESANGYRSLHITFYDNSAGCYMEMQLRTKDMDDIPYEHLSRFQNDLID